MLTESFVNVFTPSSKTKESRFTLRYQSYLFWNLLCALKKREGFYWYSNHVFVNYTCLKVNSTRGVLLDIFNTDILCKGIFKALFVTIGSGMVDTHPGASGPSPCSKCKSFDNIKMEPKISNNSFYKTQYKTAVRHRAVSFLSPRNNKNEIAVKDKDYFFLYGLVFRKDDYNIINMWLTAPKGATPVTWLLQLTGRWQYEGIMWLSLCSVKFINVDFLNQFHYFSIE